MNRRNTLVALLLALALLAVPAAFAARGGGGKPGGGGGGGGKPGGGGGSCVPTAPGVVVDNTWAWGAPGSYGQPGQQLTYAIDVINYCGSSSFVVSIAAPSGFTVSLPTNTISLGSGSSGYVWAKITSPSTAANGDYPLTVTVQQTSSGLTGSYASSYKVYSSDSVAPTLFWPSPADGATISHSSYVSVSANDDHAVKTIDLYIDNVYKSTTTCDDISSTCNLGYNWSGSVGQHTARFEAHDWMGNTGVTTTSFTAS